MAGYRLPNGREVTLSLFKMVGAYSGVLEGSLEVVSQAIRNSLPGRAASMLPPARPLAIVRPPNGELPKWFCVAELISRKGVHHNDPDYNSRLYACWFVADTARSIDAMIESTLPHLDWERLASDYNIMDF